MRLPLLEVLADPFHGSTWLVLKLLLHEVLGFHQLDGLEGEEQEISSRSLDSGVVGSEEQNLYPGCVYGLVEAAFTRGSVLSK